MHFCFQALIWYDVFLFLEHCVRLNGCRKIFLAFAHLQQDVFSEDQTVRLAHFVQ